MGAYPGVDVAGRSFPGQRSPARGGDVPHLPWAAASSTAGQSPVKSGNYKPQILLLKAVQSLQDFI